MKCKGKTTAAWNWQISLHTFRNAAAAAALCAKSDFCMTSIWSNYRGLGEKEVFSPEKRAYAAMTQTECYLLLNWNYFLCLPIFLATQKKLKDLRKMDKQTTSKKEVGWIISLDQLHFFFHHTLYTTHTMRRIVYNQPYTFIYIKSHNKTSLEAKRFLHDECQCLLGTACSVCLYIFLLEMAFIIIYVCVISVWWSKPFYISFPTKDMYSYISVRKEN